MMRPTCTPLRSYPKLSSEKPWLIVLLTLSPFSRSERAMTPDSFFSSASTADNKDDFPVPTLPITPMN